MEKCRQGDQNRGHCIAMFPPCSSASSGKLTLLPAAASKLLQSCPTLCDPTDGSPPGSPVTGILQARTLEWVAIAFLTHPQCMKVKSESEVALSCPTLSDPMDCSLPGSSVHGIFQARVLEWGAIAFSTFYFSKTSCCQNSKLQWYFEGTVLFAT